jgi:hypothetical protein
MSVPSLRRVQRSWSRIARMAGREHHLPHSLVPLALVVSTVRARVPGGDSPLRLPRPLCCVLRDGVFHEGGRQLRFVDDRPTKYALARASLVSQPPYPGAAPSH